MNLKSLFPRGSESFFNANSQSQNAEPESAVRDDALATDQRKEENPRRRILRYTSYRCRLTDPDNICPKYFTDALRYVGAISDDSLAHIDLHISQKKVDHRSQQKTLIELEL